MSRDVKLARLLLRPGIPSLAFDADAQQEGRDVTDLFRPGSGDVFADMVESARACLRKSPPKAYGTTGEHYLLTAVPAVLVASAHEGGAALWLRCAPSVDGLFSVDPHALNAHLEAADKDPWAFDGMAHLAAVLLHKGTPLPKPLQRFASQVLSGQRLRPKGRKPTTRDCPPGERYAIWEAVEFVRHRYKPAKDGIAYEAVAKALTLEGRSGGTAAAVKKASQRAVDDMRPKQASE